MLNRFIGRERDLAEVARLLSEGRLVTLSGFGGAGKTRLAREIAATTTTDVIWVELSALHDTALVPRQVADAAGLTAASDAPARALVEALAPRDALIVLDSCEHLVAAVADLAYEILDASSEIRLLVTSREPLALSGERVWPVAPLSLPPPIAADEESVQVSDAVQLFVERVRELRPDFAPALGHLTAIASICRELEGIPLAIELAAARFPTLGAGGLLERLRDGSDLLESRQRRVPGRHRSLRETIDWSYALLSDGERQVFDRLSVFAGGFRLDAAESVCADQGIVLDHVTGLVEKSLLDVREEAGGVRYSLLELLDRYAGRRLAESGALAFFRERHARYFEALISEAEPHLTTPARRTWIEQLATEAANIREALDWTLAHEPQRFVQMAGRLIWYWFATEHWDEALGRLEAALSLAALPLDRAWALFGTGVFHSLRGAGDRARPLLQEALQLAQDGGDQRLTAYADNYLGLSYAGEGDAQAAMHLERALGHFRQVEDRYGARLSLLCLGVLATARGDHAGARALIVEAVEIARVFGQPRELGIALRQLATAELSGGDPRAALAAARGSLRALDGDHHHYAVGMALEALAAALVDLGRYRESAHLFGAGEAIRNVIGVAVVPVDQRLYVPRLAEARAEAGEEFEDGWQAGRAMTIAQAIAFAGALAVEPTDPGQAATHQAPSHLSVRGAQAGNAYGPPMMRVEALGALGVQIGERRVAVQEWSHSKPKELLVYLASHPSGRTRSEIGNDLWPNRSPAQVKNSFHVALHHLRKTLGRVDMVQFDGERYLLAEYEALWFDLKRFEAYSGAAQTARDAVDYEENLREAAALYRGDFLEAEVLTGWALEQRDRFRQRGSWVLSQLGTHLAINDRLDEAQACLTQALTIDPLDEPALRALMLLLGRTGERRRALRHYERLCALLNTELRALPEPATRDVAEQLLRADATEPVHAI